MPKNDIISLPPEIAAARDRINGMAPYSALVIDAGNTSTTLALYRSGEKTIEASVPVRGGISAARGECAKAIRRVFAAADAHGEAVSFAMLSSVTPGVNESWRRLVREESGLELSMVRHDMPLPFAIGVPVPASVGADQIADMAAAVMLYGSPSIVIDIGTAVSYDLISEDGRFFVCVIGPGPEILARSLHDYTALLPLVEWWEKEPPQLPNDTEGAMLFGIDAGFCGTIRETVKRLLPLSGNSTRLIATGGFAPRFVSQLGMDFIIDRDLTLKGIGLLAGISRSVGASADRPTARSR